MHLIFIQVRPALRNTVHIYCRLNGDFFFFKSLFCPSLVPTWAVVAIAIVAGLILLCCCFCICKKCCCKKRKKKEGKKGLKGAVDLKSVQMLGNSYKEKVRLPFFSFLLSSCRSLYLGIFHFLHSPNHVAMHEHYIPLEIHVVNIYSVFFVNFDHMTSSMLVQKCCTYCLFER